MAERLEEAEIKERVAALAAWEYKEGELVRNFVFRDFNEAMDFVNQVAERAEAANHHPDIDIRWNKVLLRLATHSKGGVTELDFNLAQEISAL